MLSKTVMVNGKPYTVEINNTYAAMDYIEYKILFLDDTNSNAFDQTFILKEEVIPNYISMVQETREAFKQQIANEELWTKARKEFEEWDGGEASSEAPNSEVSAC